MPTKLDHFSNNITEKNQNEIKNILGKSDKDFKNLKEEIKNSFDFNQIFKIIFNTLGSDRKNKSAEEVNKVPGMAFLIQAMIDLLDDYSGYQKIYNNQTLGEMLRIGGGIDNINGKNTKKIVKILQHCFGLNETGLADGKFIDTILSRIINTNINPNETPASTIQYQATGNLIPTYNPLPTFTTHPEIAVNPGTYIDGEDPLPYNEKEGKVERGYEVLGSEGIEYFDLGKHETPNGMSTYHRFIEKVKKGGVDRRIASANIHICVGTDAVPCRPGITKHNKINYEKKRDSIIALLNKSSIDNKTDIRTFLLDPSPGRLSPTDKNGNKFANNWLAGERFLEAVGDAIRAFQHQKGMKINFFFDKNWSKAGKTHDKRDERYVTTYMNGLVEKTNPGDPIIERLKKKQIVKPLPKYGEIGILAQEQRDGREVVADTSTFPVISFKTTDGISLGEITIDTTTGYVTNINGARIRVSYDPPKQIIIYFI